MDFRINFKCETLEEFQALVAIAWRFAEDHNLAYVKLEKFYSGFRRNPDEAPKYQVFTSGNTTCCHPAPTIGGAFENAKWRIFNGDTTPPANR